VRILHSGSVSPNILTRSGFSPPFPRSDPHPCPEDPLLLKQAGHSRRATGMVDGTTRLLGLEGLAVAGVADGLDGRWCMCSPSMSRRAGVPSAGPEREGLKGKTVKLSRVAVCQGVSVQCRGSV